MKVVLVNTQTYGGAGVVVKRLHQSLLDLNIDSWFLSKYGMPGELPNHLYLKNARLRNFLRKGLSNQFLAPIARVANNLRVHPNLVNRPQGFEMFSLLRHIELGAQYALLENADLIHLHWISDFVPYKEFFKKFSTKRFVWTLHDMNPITGGCHHADGCGNFQAICSPCPQLKNTIDENFSEVIQQNKLEALSVLADDQLTIVSPSQWLLNLSKKSKITSRFKHILVKNPTFASQPFLESREQLRKSMGLPTDKKIIIFASESLGKPRKGVHTLFDAVRSLPERNDIVLVGIGNEAEPQRGLNLHYRGTISDMHELANYFYMADLFVTASVAENSPLVVIESLSCGTPVVASNVGGIPEVVDLTNGILFPVGDTESLSKSIISALFYQKFDREVIMKKVRAAHDPLQVGQRYIELYQSVLTN